MEFSEVIAGLREEYSHLRFILVTSPSPRCGVTLMQRMINAGGQCVIYGENMYFLYKLPSATFGYGVEGFSKKVEITRDTADRFFGGHRSMDASTLFPDYVRYVRENIRSFYRLVELYQEESQMRGANCWGIKCPMFEPGCARALLKLLPLPQMIIITRDLGAVARSWYARWPNELKHPEAFRTLGYRWAANKKFLDAIQGDQVLHINYEEWMKNPDMVANSIEKTFGVRVAREEIERKINLPDNDPKVQVAQRRKGGWYLPPQDLPPEADEWLQQGVRRFLEQGST